MQKENNLKIRKIARLPNLLALGWEGDYLYASRGYKVYRINIKDVSLTNAPLENAGFFRADFVRKIASGNIILKRLLRLGFHTIRFLPDSRIIGIAAKNIVVLEPGRNEFISTFRIKRGTRPLGMAVTPDGKIYWGEYFDNPKRKEVHVYGSADGGYNWSVVYSFPRNTIRHIHNIFYDPYASCFWILAGDEDKEPRIARASTDWKKVDIILGGTQQSRAATMILREDSIFYATDTPHEQNYIYRLDRKTAKANKIFPLPGPSMYGCAVDSAMFFSTASEPGKISYSSAAIYGSADGSGWECLTESPKDSLNPRYFQFGNFVLPAGNKCFLAATGIAVKEEDYTTTIWEVEKS